MGQSTLADTSTCSSRIGRQSSSGEIFRTL